MLGLVAYAPFRPKNLASLEIERHLVLVRDRWFVIIPREETKTKKPIQFEIPKILVPYLTFYLDTIRPTILRGRMHNALWVSPKGGALSYVGICKILPDSRSVSECGFLRTTRAMLLLTLGQSQGLIKSALRVICFITPNWTRLASTIGLEE